MVGSTPPSPAQPAVEEHSGERKIDRPTSPTTASELPTPFYSFRALFVPRPSSQPPAPRPSTAARIASAFVMLVLPVLAGGATYALLTRRAPAPSYVFVANANAFSVDLVVDGQRRGAVPARGSARVELGIGPHVFTALAAEGLVDETTVQIPSPGARVLFNLGGHAALAIVTRGYGASQVDVVQPVPPGRVLPLPADVDGELVDEPFPPSVTAPEGQSAATVVHLCSFDPVRRRIGCQGR
jgi:hypothetical protein